MKVAHEEFLKVSFCKKDIQKENEDWELRELDKRIRDIYNESKRKGISAGSREDS